METKQLKVEQGGSATNIQINFDGFDLSLNEYREISEKCMHAFSKRPRFFKSWINILPALIGPGEQWGGDLEGIKVYHKPTVCFCASWVSAQNTETRSLQRKKVRLGVDSQTSIRHEKNTYHRYWTSRTWRWLHALVCIAGWAWLRTRKRICRVTGDARVWTWRRRMESHVGKTLVHRNLDSDADLR